MANSNSPFGFRWLGLNGGSASATDALITRAVASNDSTAIGKGDPVKNLVTGYVAQWTASTAVSQLAGIFVGCKYYNTALQRVVWSPYWPGSGATGDVEVYLTPCINSPAPSFVVQATSTPFTFVDIGANCDVDLGTVNTMTGQSGATLNRSTIGTTATLPFRVTAMWSQFGASGSIGTDTTASYDWVVVAANTDQATGLTT